MCGKRKLFEIGGLSSRLFFCGNNFGIPYVHFDKTLFLFILASALTAACQTTATEGEIISTPLNQPPTEEPDLVIAEPVQETAGTNAELVPIAPQPNPEDLLGLEPKDIQALLGPVSLKRWEGEAQVMQFANEHCVMDIYFYEETPGAAFYASYLNARLKDGAEISSDVCLIALLPGGVWPEAFRETVFSRQ